ncbi:hypothetical protein KBZ12_17340 [Cyanobium sp. Cruz CV13-4-11]|jgi:aromatic ring-cleaving dioxygenase|uniref:DOPA 4,5-dioxygenase family protein n=1 Tax=unclassified Cyanobium TaxID=2627006 RepID=UPI0020CD2B31|nr:MULTISPECIES: DOPA 4,5-dioxygenase family protein [unclassified Cyanobium]MCP9859428.1 hypothetical protein [Cyanobium sp. Cruz-8H5]MCP9866630.1 hypothetical protein [Cyanobium sp. Cruz-8D1]MCP9902336.1 hypothetical protein [Cyanobium sp. Cruz CV11-17]MCP9921206.1 hypothetical protein [Cyanobium sp. Cruz CV13-4-11]
MTRRPSNIYERHHAHVYCGAASVAQPAGARFGLPVGPHPLSSCQISFGREDFEALIPWLETHRGGLTVLVHGVTGG